MKKILIAGENSYIGLSVKEWLGMYPDKYYVETVKTRNNNWEQMNFSNYDVVFNVAGIAHVKITTDMENTFYKVNRDLAINLCKKAKEEGVSQYIYLSSMNVYGDTSELITEDFDPKPQSFYGDSKLQADKAIQEMNSGTFKVVSIRPPVVYGAGCKGNYPKLAKLATLSPVFPDFENTRSMIYIDNLSELIRLLIDNFESGIFHPQNREYTTTVDLVKEIAKVHNKKIYTTKLFNPIINFLLYRVRIINRAFADDRYSMELSNYKDFEYCVVGFKESIKRAESK